MTIYPPLVEVIKSRNAEMARTLVRRALESLDAAWARRHPPPGAASADQAIVAGPAPEAVAPPAPRAKKEKKR